MTGHPPPAAFLRRLPLSHNAVEPSSLYPLATRSEAHIGRDPRCEVVFESSGMYGGISRRHAKVAHVPESSEWQICDLNSANGTYVNGQRIQGCCPLRHGDRIALGQGEAQLIFELPPRVQSAPLMPPPAAVSAPASFVGTAPVRASNPPSGAAPDSVTFSQLFPIVSTGRDLTRKAYLIPGILTVSFVVLMFVAVGNPLVFNLLLAAYLAGAAYYFIYQLCGKHKPWWLLAGAAAVTMLVLGSPLLKLFIFVFRDILPGAVPKNYQSVNFFVLLVRMFFGAGLMEELIKALPILLALWIGQKLPSPRREQIGVWEPLDGILLGTASAVGFTLLETLGQYVPGIISDANLQAGANGELVGLQLLIPRILGSVSGHMAYSGYLGYFIGLSVLKPSKRWQILSIGYLSAAALHALWNSTGAINLVVLALVGVLSYAFLAAAILKARALSPTRSQNFATRFTRLP